MASFMMAGSETKGRRIRSAKRWSGELAEPATMTTPWRWAIGASSFASPDGMHAHSSRPPSGRRHDQSGRCCLSSAVSRSRRVLLSRRRNFSAAASSASR